MSGDSQREKERILPKDEFARRELLGWLWQLWFIPVLVAGVVAFSFAAITKKSKASVVVYCAQDQVFAEAIFQDFTRETGIRVRAVYDSEAVKTVGLANRLMAERAHPQADLFWGNEEMRTRQLAAQGVFRETNGWAAFGYRSRRLVLNTNFISAAAAPKSLLELTNAAYQGRVALAYPQFGTTATHFHALRQFWGDAAWQAWCRGLAANQPKIVDGNSVVVKTVGRGDAWVGLTDSDDIAGGQEEKLPVAAVPLSPGMLLIPNTAAIVRGAPHPAAAQRLFDYLQQPKVIERLVAVHALEGVSANAGAAGLPVDWDKLLRDLKPVIAELGEIFLR